MATKGVLKKILTTSSSNPSKLARIGLGPAAAALIGSGVLATGAAIKYKKQIKSTAKKIAKAPKEAIDKIKENRDFKKQQRIIAEQKKQEQLPKTTFNRKPGSKVPRANK
jgi:hypothetical protein